jgi:glycerophosphoryl diester phosphodiesterase
MMTSALGASQGTSEAPFPRLCAHRGLSQACPENTLPALAAAIAVGTYEIECDVWLSRDGVPVVCHDASVDRTTDGKGLIADLFWEDIRRLDAGIKMSEAWRGIRIPRLEQVLELTDGRVGLNIHIKEAGPQGRLVMQVCDLLRERRLLGSAYIAGGAEAVLQAAQEYCPDLPRACLLASDNPAMQVELAQQYACQRIQFRRNVTEEHIRRAHEMGILCNLFWSDDPEDGLEYVRKGIDVILTNCAHVMMAGGFQALCRCGVD